MYIEPQGIFKLIQGVPFHSDKKHQLYFTSASSQLSYFNSKVKYTFTDFTYVRAENVIRVPLVADNVYDCNYCMFQNRGFGTKWFFAFITDVRYKNNGLAEVEIMIDHFQTWLFEMSIGTSFVEREHVADDTIGLHTLDEGLDFGNNVVQKIYHKYFGQSSEQNSWKVVIAYSPNYLSTKISATGETQGQVIGNQYTVSLVQMALNADTINAEIDSIIQAGYQIINVYMYPSEFDDLGQLRILPYEHGILRPTKFEQTNISEDSYTPRNNKLLTYPYTYMLVSNNQGNEVEFRWEDMGTGQLPFDVKHNFINSVCCELRTSYEGDTSYNRLYSIPLNDFPTCAWSESDFYKNILVGNIGTLLSNILHQNVGGGLTEASINTSKSTISAPSVKGNATIGSLDIRLNTFGYSFYLMAIKPEYARIVDDYFTRFGYKVNRYKVPELTSRTSFNYVKTRECEVEGNIPDEAMNYISDMFNNGVTLWHTTTTVGDFTQDNSIV